MTDHAHAQERKNTNALPAERVTFLQLARPVRGRVITSGVLSALGAVSGIVPVIFAMALAARLTSASSGETTPVLPLVVWLVVSVVCAQALSMAAYSVSHAADATFGEYLRQQQITQSLRLRLDWFSREGSGRMKKIVQDDVAKIHQLIAHVVPDTTNAIARPVASILVLFVIDVRIGLVGLIPLACAIACMPLMMKDMTKRYEAYNASLEGLNGAIVEFVRGIAPIKVFEASGKGTKRFRGAATLHHTRYSEWMEQTVYGSALIMAFASPAFAMMSTAMCTGAMIIAGVLSPIMIVPSVLLAANIAGPLFMLAQMRQFMREASGSAQNIAAFFSLEAAPDVVAWQQPLGSQLDIEGVSFHYDGGVQALSDVSLTLAPGTVTALVGASGSGKSTLASLVPRLLDPDSGELRLGGVATAKLSGSQLYEQVAFVFQQPFLLRLSVRDNIRLARPEASDEAVIAAAKAAQVHDRIMRLPGGYDSVIGEQARLSGGEQQRLSIARALLMNAPLLVLDEATAFADPDSEAAIQAALAELTRGKTLLVVAHRLHTITGAEQIVVLDGGRVSEVGTHEQLLALDGSYAAMWKNYCDARSLGMRSFDHDAHPQTNAHEPWNTSC